MKRRTGPNAEDVEAAVKNVINNKISIRSAAKLYHVSKSALARIVKEVKSTGDMDNFKYKPKYDINMVFNEKEERELIEYIKHSARLHYGLTTQGIRELAYKYAKLNGKKYPKEWEKGQSAGEGWLRCFRQRHGHEIALRKPEATSIARATSFTKENVNKFFFQCIKMFWVAIIFLLQKFTTSMKPESLRFTHLPEFWLKRDRSS